LALHLKVGEAKRLWFGDAPLAVVWTPMDSSVATIDNDTGRVTGVSKGLCIVKAQHLVHLSSVFTLELMRKSQYKKR
jgi:uncharacterized protein YjdB